MKLFETVKKLFWVSRPISWPNTSYPFLVGFLLASVWPLSSLDIATLVVSTLYFIGPYNLLMYGVNDVFDYESDIRNPRKGGIEGMKESRQFHPTILKAVLVTNVPFLVYLFAVGSWPARIVLAFVVFAALAYSLNGLRFKEIPFFDSVTSSFHFVSPLVFALALVGSSQMPGRGYWLSLPGVWHRTLLAQCKISFPIGRASCIQSPPFWVRAKQSG